MNYVKTVKIVIFFLLLSPAIFADEIHLKNNDHITGQLISLSPTICAFVTPYQAVLQIKREQLLRLHTTHPVTVELYSGERLIGSLTTNQDGQLSLHSQNFGKLALQLTEIKIIKSLDKEIISLNSHLSNEKVLNHVNDQYPLLVKKPKKDLFVSKQRSSLLNVQGRGTKNDPEQPSSEEKSLPTIGEKDEETRMRLLVPQSELQLINPGEKELEISFGYIHDQFDEIRRRDLAFSGTLHVGLIDKLAAFIDVPFTWTEQELLDDNFTKDSNFGIGDVSIGFNYLLVPEDDKWPDILASLAITTPTGDKPDFANPNNVSLGNGHWGITTGLWLMKSYDPVILFGSLSYTHTFAEKFNGIQETPGDGVSYMFGTGFAINNKIAIFSHFEGYYQMEGERDGMKVLGSTNEQMYLHNYLTYTLQSGNYIQPGLTFGLNDEAADVGFNLVYFYKF